MKSLLDLLKQYNQSDYYPFHMPGHKRNPKIDYIPAGIDITEIEGFDNLHKASGLLMEAQKRAAALYGAKESFFLVNGSTAGILSAISAAAPWGSTVLFARNSHKAAYHGMFLRNHKAEYVFPEILGEYGICGGICPAQIADKLENNPEIGVVYITSPTYEGMVSNIEEIADITHRNHCILIVDEAHGAHFGLGSEYFPKSALFGNADIVIQSLHKTMPSLTQTAIMHIQGSRVDCRSIKKYLQIYQTSSPSYVFMAGMDSCIRLMENHRIELFAEYEVYLRNFYEEVQDLKYLHVLQPEECRKIACVKMADPSKICIFTTNSGMAGIDLYHILLEKYHLQMEMAAGNYVLAMTSIMDRAEGFERLKWALWEIDKGLAVEKNYGGQLDYMKRRMWRISGQIAAEVVMTAAQAEGKNREVIPICESKGRISLEYRYVYPPGMPVLVPGERITDDVLEFLEYNRSVKLNIQGQEIGEDVIAVVQ